MAKFNVVIGYYGSASVMVDADNQEQAIEQARDIIASWEDKEFVGQCEFTQYGSPDVWEEK